MRLCANAVSVRKARLDRDRSSAAAKALAKLGVWITCKIDRSERVPKFAKGRVGPSQKKTRKVTHHLESRQPELCCQASSEVSAIINSQDSRLFMFFVRTCTGSCSNT